MNNLDLDIIQEDKKTVKLFSKEVAFKTLTVEEHLKNEAKVLELDNLSYDKPEEVEKASELIKEYILGVLELSDEEASKISMKQFKKLREFIGRQELYDQGFTDKEIDKIEKEAAKKQIKNILP